RETQPFTLVDGPLEANVLGVLPDFTQFCGPVRCQVEIAECLARLPRFAHHERVAGPQSDHGTPGRVFDPDLLRRRCGGRGGKSRADKTKDGYRTQRAARARLHWAALAHEALASSVKWVTMPLPDRVKLPSSPRAFSSRHRSLP